MLIYYKILRKVLSINIYLLTSSTVACY